jgi:hypothetical protein
MGVAQFLLVVILAAPDRPLEWFVYLKLAKGVVRPPPLAKNGHPFCFVFYYFLKKFKF